MLSFLVSDAVIADPSLSLCPKRLAADAAASGKDPTLTSLKRGTGYRSSFSGLVATVFGASGAIGRGVCSRLGKSGAQVCVTVPDRDIC